MATKKAVEEVVSEFEVSRYSGEEIAKSERFKQYAVLLSAELELNTEYTIDEVKAIIDKALKRKVKEVVNE